MVNTIIANDFEHKGIKENVHSVGIVSGTFRPLHLGHMNLINKSEKENDLTIVIVSGYKEDRAEKIGMPLIERFQRIREEFSENKNVFVALLDEKIHKEFDDLKGLSEYKESVLQIIDCYTTKRPTVINNYVGDKAYKPILEKAYPDFNTILVDRESKESIDISATKILTDPYKYWDYICPSFYGYFRKVILIIGASSTGKTTLSKNLAKEFKANWVQEVGRTYTEGWRHTIESLINSRDYMAFIDGQLDSNETALWDKKDKSKYLFIDTDGLVTRTYLKLGLEEMDSKYREALITLSELSVNWTKNNVDLILVTPYNTEFVMDGSRDGHLDKFRKDYFNLLMEQVTEFSLENKCYLLKEKTYEERTDEAISKVKVI